MDCSSPGSSIHGILQARILEWVAISFSRGSSWPRDRTQVSCIAGRFFTDWDKGSPLSCTSSLYILEIKSLSIALFANIFSQSVGLDNYSHLAEKAPLLLWGTYYPPSHSSACSKDPPTSKSLLHILQVFFSTPNLTFTFTSTWMVLAGLAVSWPPHLQCPLLVLYSSRTPWTDPTTCHLTNYSLTSNLTG